MRFVLWGVMSLGAFSLRASSTPALPYEAGIAQIDITPEEPTRLTGYGVRRSPSTGVDQKLWAKALALSSVRGEVFVWLTVDNCGLPESMREVVLDGIRSRGVSSARFALSFSHTHSAPMVNEALPYIFSEEVPVDHQRAIDRYTAVLTEKLVAVALQAIDDLQAAELEWGTGKLRFAFNRREHNGPVDHDLPVLVVKSDSGEVRSILTSYACHATTLGPDFNQVHGDWVGSAQMAIEAHYPGVMAMVAVGCAGELIPEGARLLPDPLRLEETDRLGGVVADEVERVIDRGLVTLTGALHGRIKRTALPLASLPSMEEWLDRIERAEGIDAYHARMMLDRINHGEELPTEIPYLVQSWSFGDELAVIFMAGEVVGDYSLRLKEELDAARIWVNAYTNDIPGYIPSRRALRIGEYEAVESTRYYGLPTSFAPEVEETVIQAVHEVVGDEFLATQASRMMGRRTTPEEALSLLQTKPDLTVELVVAEPLVIDPVAIEFGTDGRLWVVEMRDYPMGIDGNWKPGGRVRVLTDTDGDGTYDQADTFADDLPFPTGVMPWRNGVLICAAPDILYVEDRDGDGRADHTRTILTGFTLDNFQARVNSLSLGLDGWIHAANGLRDGVIYNPDKPDHKVDIRGHDIRFQPDSGVFETVAGHTQFSRLRDDWGNWFGCSAGVTAMHFPMEERYLRRNPHVVSNAGAVYLAPGGDHAQLFPLSPPRERFNQGTQINHATSACGIGAYRDDFMGTEFYGDVFTCEPVYNIVTRLKLAPRGATFSGRRAPDESDREFLASTSNWFTPVQARTGPDGGLWVVDMVRPVIEHPRWISPDRLAHLEVRAGDDAGRIFRVIRPGEQRRKIRDLTRLSVAELVAAMDTSNGPTRDLVELELIFRGGDAAFQPLDNLLHTAKIPAVRLQALSTLRVLGGLSVDQVKLGLTDGSAGVRRYGLKLAEQFIDRTTMLDRVLGPMVNDPDPAVRTQLALTLGEWHDVEAGGRFLGQLALADLDDALLRTAILSSAFRSPQEVINTVLADDRGGEGKGALLAGLVVTAAMEDQDLDDLFVALAPRDDSNIEAWRYGALAGLQRVLDQRGVDIRTYGQGKPFAVRNALESIRTAYLKASDIAQNTSSGLSERRAALGLLGRGFNQTADNLPVLVGFLDGMHDDSLTQAAVESIKRVTGPEVPSALFAQWTQFPPSVRSTVLDILMSRHEWADQFLRALETGDIAIASVPSETRQRLLTHQHADMQARAERLFASTTSPDRKKVITQYGSVTELVGDPENGLQIFKNSCAACHVYVGRSVGPPLHTYRSKSAEDFLVAILDPNAAIEPKHVGYAVTLKDGRAFAGTISEESASSFVLLQIGNVRQEILRNEVAAVTALDVSFMPEGLEAGISVQAMADLISYLKSAQESVGPSN